MLRKIPTLRVNVRQILLSRRYLCDKINKKSDEKSKEIELPPEPTTCCASGCADCVWIKYANEISEKLEGQEEEVIEKILEKITDQNLKMFLKMELRMRGHAVK